MKNLFYLLLLTLVFIVGCDKSTELQLNSESISTDKQFENPTNLNIRSQIYNENPFEFVGIEHNKMLAEFTPLLEESIQRNEWENIEFMSDQYITKFSDLANKAYYNYYPESTLTISDFQNLYNELDINEWYDGDSLTMLDIAENALLEKASTKDREFTMNLLNTLFDVVENVENDSLAFCALEDVISEQEILILSEEWTSDEHYALGTLAVAKYSTMYWKNYKFNKNGINTRNLTMDRNKAIVIADAVGYAAGGVVGGTVGGITTGPAGGLGGFFLGKAVGAFGASGATATAFTIYDAFKNAFGL